MIRKSGHRFSIATKQKCVCAEIMRKQKAKARLRFDLTQSRFSGSPRIEPAKIRPEQAARHGLGQLLNPRNGEASGTCLRPPA